MKKKIIHNSPMQYRVIYRGESFAEPSTQYYSVSHSSEALDFLAHTFQAGHLEGNALEILKVDEFDRFRTKWQCRLAPALEHCKATGLHREGGEIWLRKKN